MKKTRAIPSLTLILRATQFAPCLRAGCTPTVGTSALPSTGGDESISKGTFRWQGETKRPDIVCFDFIPQHAASVRAVWLCGTRSGKGDPPTMTLGQARPRLKRIVASLSQQKAQCPIRKSRPTFPLNGHRAPPSALSLPVDGGWRGWDGYRGRMLGCGQGDGSEGQMRAGLRDDSIKRITSMAKGG